MNILVRDASMSGFPEAKISRGYVQSVRVLIGISQERKRNKMQEKIEPKSLNII